MILDEILGEDGPSLHHGDVTANLSSKPEIAALLAVADNLFDLNPVWRMAAHDLCAYAKATGANSVRMRAFSNEDILRTIAGITIGYPAYAPALEFEIRRGDDVEYVFGTIEWDGRKPDFDRIITEYFEGDSFHYFMLRHVSGHRQVNADLMSELGLSFSIVRLDDQGPIPVRVRSASIEDARGQPRQFLAAFPAANSDFVDQLVGLFLQHEQEFMQLYERMAFSFTEAGLEEFKSADLSPAEPQFWGGSIERCDVCERDMSQARFMIDSAIVANGPWGCMCAACFCNAGGRIGWGSGQLYERYDHGWRLVGGERPPDESDEFD